MKKISLIQRMNKELENFLKTNGLKVGKIITITALMATILTGCGKKVTFEKGVFYYDDIGPKVTTSTTFGKDEQNNVASGSETTTIGSVPIVTDDFIEPGEDEPIFSEEPVKTSAIDDNKGTSQTTTTTKEPVSTTTSKQSEITTTKKTTSTTNKPVEIPSEEVDITNAEIRKSIDDRVKKVYLQNKVDSGNIPTTLKIVDVSPMDSGVEVEFLAETKLGASVYYNVKFIGSSEYNKKMKEIETKKLKGQQISDKDLNDLNISLLSDINSLTLTANDISVYYHIGDNYYYRTINTTKKEYEYIRIVNDNVVERGAVILSKRLKDVEQLKQAITESKVQNNELGL